MNIVGYQKIKLTKNRAGLLYLTVKVNHIKGLFIVDTGASSTVIDWSRAKRFGLTLGATIKRDGGGIGGSSIKTTKTCLKHFEISGLKVKPFKTSIIDLSHVNQSLKKHRSRQVDGIIGANIFRKHKALIDYGTQAIYLKRLKIIP